MSQCTQTWETCSPEILDSILKYTSYETLLNCMQVNKFWRDVSIYTGNKYGQWEQLTYDKMTNNGVSFRQRTKLNWKDIYKNSLLWLDIGCAEKYLYHIYDVHNISKINVYHDNLIVISPSEVKYFHIETCKEIRSIQTSCIDYDETDYIILEVKLQDNLNYKLLTLNGKTCPAKFESDKNGTVELTDVFHYKLENEYCYVLDNRNVIWQHRWDYKCWKTNALSRYYGQPHTVGAFCVYYNDVYLFTKVGNVYRVEKHLLKLEKSFFVAKTEPFHYDKHFALLLSAFYKHHVLGGKAPDINLFNGHDILTRLAYPTAALDHGDAVILGYDDGLVLIRVFDQKNASPINSTTTFNINEFMSLEGNASDIASLNVYEAKNSHHIFVATNKYIFQVQLLHR